MAKSFEPKDIARYYDVNTKFYRLIWFGRKSLGIHFGYYDSGITDSEDAILNVNKTLATAAGIKSDDKVFDAGCGVGGSAIWIAKHIGAKVVGFTISPHQINKAYKYAKIAGVEDKVEFIEGNYDETKFPDASFDVVWAIESVCYSKNKLKTLKEFYRLLKPGGKLVMSDEFVYSYAVSDEDRKLIDRLAHGYMLESFATPEEFEKDLAEAGFKDIKLTDKHRDMEINLRRAIPRVKRYSLLAKILPKIHPYFKEVEGNFDGAIAGGEAFYKGLWTLEMVYAKKPQK